MDDFSRGLLLGLLITVGHFGGDGRQPQITVRMHARHRALFSWLLAAVPDSRLYGPYGVWWHSSTNCPYRSLIRPPSSVTRL